MTPDEAVKEWALRRLRSYGIKPSEILRTDFGIGDDGGCSTCSSPYAGVEVYYKLANGHKKYEVIEPQGGLTELFEEVHRIMMGS